MTTPTYITPKILTWAINHHFGSSREEIASKIDVSEECLQEWENGKSYPTRPQVRQLADIFDIPFGFFFLSKPPNTEKYVIEQQFANVLKECLKKMRYGNLFKDFSVEELNWYGRIKAKRALILYEKENFYENAIDDALDAINMLIMTKIRMVQVSNNQGEEGSLSPENH